MSMALIISLYTVFACMSNNIRDLVVFQEYSLDTINRQTVTVIPDSLFCVQVQSCECETQKVSILDTLSSSQISSQSDSLFLGCNTIFKIDRLPKPQKTSVSLLKRIADNLELGSDKWYGLHNDSIDFLDGDQELDSRELKSRNSSFR